MAQRLGLNRKHLVKGGAIDFIALEQGPGIGVGIGAVDGANKIVRQAALSLKPIKGLKGRCRKHAAKVPNHCLDHDFAISLGDIENLSHL